jgi:hypothetical protein
MLVEVVLVVLDEVLVVELVLVVVVSVVFVVVVLDVVVDVVDSVVEVVDAVVTVVDVVVVLVVVDVVARDVVEVVGTGGSSASRSATNASTFPSMTVASPVVLQPPLLSDFAKLLENVASHLATFAGSIVPPFAACFDSSAHLHTALLVAALSLSDSHRLGSVPVSTFSSASKSMTKASTFVSMAAASPVVAQPPFTSLLANALEKVASHLAILAGSTVPP